MGGGEYKITCRRPAQVLHCKKRFAIFPSPAGMSLTKLSLGGNSVAWGEISCSHLELLLMCLQAGICYMYLNNMTIKTTYNGQ
jgi:hypothetical protein